MKEKLRRFSTAVFATVAATACTDDPTESLRNGAVQVTASLSYVEIIIADSVVATAQTVDAQGNALQALPDVNAANPGVASVNIDTVISGKPVPETQFSILANGFGTTTVTVSAGAFSRDITVQTWPSTVNVTGAPAAGTTVPSGGSVQLSATAWGSNNSPFTVGNDLLTFVWSSGGPSAAVDSTGLARAQAPGLAVISVTADGPVATGQASFEVVPGPFSGAGLAGPYTPADQVTLTMGAGLLFDSTASISVDGIDVFGWTPNSAGTQVTFGVEERGVGTHEVVVAGLGASELAESATYSQSAVYTPNAPGTPLDITAQLPGVIYTVLDGTNTDDYFRITPATDLDITVTMDWSNNGDIDILWRDCPNSMFIGNFDGATSAQPEVSSVSIAAGECWLLRINDYDGSTQRLIKLDITSP